MAGRLWLRVMKKNRLVRDLTVPCGPEGWREALVSACRGLDIEAPLVIARHERDFERFLQTRFLPEHFVERVSFDRLEVEYFDPDRPRGPGNPDAP